jgi:hypothetical protein
MCFEAHQDRYVNSAMRLSITQLAKRSASHIRHIKLWVEDLARKQP